MSYGFFKLKRGQLIAKKRTKNIFAVRKGR
jgi:hypothetical protein